MITTVTLNAAIDKTYWLDNLTVGTANRVKKAATEAGGKGVNVAKVLSTLGNDVTVTGLIGGSDGRLIIERLKEFPVNQQWSEISQNSRTCLNIIDESGKVETEILENGPAVSEKEWKRFISHLKEIANESSLVLFSGSLPSGLPADSYKTLVEELQAKGIFCGVDTSGEPLKKCLEIEPEIIKPNKKELEDFCGRKLDNLEDVIAEAKLIHQKGVKYVFVTLGKEGAIAVGDTGIYQAIIPEIKSVNSVGSGDATFAGIGGVLQDSDDIELALLNGMAAGIANALQTKAGRVNRQDYLDLQQKISVKKIG
ncbi:1-phosphofructokinase family hexose kinase [Thalassobacillus pellis]|uniref:1-phosphofructokinase family hexose kinase n=1 Tax=Thalassobacillus pellis TaxID=748008 RepID=UPI00195F846F|nr:1-phosphofructokinase family hexose kinase [Thalassobacillus pellis]MBM7551575.1 1-phosphofructokinase family hexose kinase [Thalassobacillus pellis]